MTANTITEILEEYIRGASLKIGDRLPAEQKMAKDLGITRHQLRKGINSLKKHKKLRQRRGSGTYIDKGITIRPPKEKLIVLISPIDPLFSETIDQFQQETFNRGYQLVVVNSPQTPEFERDYLHKLIDNQPTGLIINPSPHYQNVFSDIERLRQDGTKVAVLSAPPERLNNYAVFAYDYFKAGYNSCFYLMSKGYQKQYILSSLHIIPHGWHYQSHLAGVQQAAEEFNIDLKTVYAHAHFDEVTQNLEWQRTKPFPLENSAGYICGNYRQAILLEHDLQNTGKKGYKIFSLSIKKVPFPFAYFHLDETKRFELILDYILNPKIPASKNIQNMFTPKLIDENV